MAVWSRMIPLNFEVVPRVVWPATCQKTFLERAPLIRMTCLPELIPKVWAIWKIQTSFEPPER